MGIQVRDERLLDVVDANAAIATLESGFSFTEGPIWHPQERHLTFSDIPANKLFRWSESAGLALFREPSNMANGNTYDHAGRMLSCEHATSRVTRTEADGAITVLASHYEGKELNSPNDIVVRKDGTIWFTDPTYGRQGHTGVAREPELDFRGVYCLNPQDGALTLAAQDFDMPNGLAFTLDHASLYVADTPRMHIRKFDVLAGGSLAGGAVFAKSTGDGLGAPDGLKIDSAGHVFCAGPGGVHIYHPADGACLGVIETPKFCANFAWGGESLRTLFLTASDCLHCIEVNTPGLALF